MQFVKKGPDIPERLLQAHEDGKVVFFCGAGISYPAGLPTFRSLATQLYDAMGIDPDPVQASAIKSEQYDTAVGLLESKVQGGRQTVRTALASILTPDPQVPNATATHEALLTLGRDRQGKTRLVTTNFDRLFEEVMPKGSEHIECFRAPALPVPKKRWDGLVYLHGLLTEEPSESDLDRLVVSSGDFGLAYLTERWAARFVSELLRNFVVCFVGYSISDPVMRYMMDALAADRQLGESAREHFAFGRFSNGTAEDAEREWRVKNVTPILYREHQDHRHLHETLQIWSETYRDGVFGKEQIVVQNAMSRPFESTERDGVVGRMIWALSDPSGLPARRFAEFDPVPPLDWLEPLTNACFGRTDLQRFGKSASGAADEELSFGLTQRPAPYGLASWMALVGSGTEATRWDDVMFRIAQWLTRHLNDPKLMLWFVRHGGVLHRRLARCVEAKLDELSGLEEPNDQVTLRRIRANAPNAIPDGRMRTLWQLVLTGQVRRPADGVEFYRWRKEFQRHGLTLTLRFDLREKLRPCVVLREPFGWPTETVQEETDAQKDMDKWVRADVVLGTQEIRHQLQELNGNERWADALPGLLDDFTRLLRDVLDLRRELEQVHGGSDLSYLDQPSISEHAQNHGYRDWTVLIELVRDAWLQTRVRSPEEARVAAEAWWRVRYPVFRRLAFFAATHGEIIPGRRAVEWLLFDQGWWLWSHETRREAMRLLVSLGPRLEREALDRVERAILAGPPRTLYRADIEPDLWTRFRDQDIWMRLSKLMASGASLSSAGATRMQEISAGYPLWRVSDDEREEFTGWMGVRSGGREVVATPLEQEDLIEWLRTNADRESWTGDDWSERCRRDARATSDALCELAKQNAWPRRFWQQALHAWTQDDLIKPTWPRVAPVVAGSSDDVLRALGDGVSRWLLALAKTFEGEDGTFLTLCNRLLDLEYGEELEVEDPVGRAINHPVGHATDALLQWWYRKQLTDAQGLDDHLKRRFSRICDVCAGAMRHGRVLLAANVVTLFRVDRDWATRWLLPLFSWEHSMNEAKAAWAGFLWTPRLYAPLMEALKPEFLDTAHYYEELGQYGNQYSSLLTFAALDPQGVFTPSELRRAMVALPQDGVDNAAATVVRALKAAGGQRAEYWKNRVLPYVRDVWPKTRERASASVAENFALLCVAAGEDFPGAIEELRPWLEEVEYPDRVVQELHKMGLHERFPKETLRLLDGIVGRDAGWLPRKKMEDCFRAMRAKSKDVERDPRFQRLVEQVRRQPS